MSRTPAHSRQLPKKSALADTLQDLPRRDGPSPAQIPAPKGGVHRNTAFPLQYSRRWQTMEMTYIRKRSAYLHDPSPKEWTASVGRLSLNPSHKSKKANPLQPIQCTKAPDKPKKASLHTPNLSPTPLLPLHHLSSPPPEGDGLSMWRATPQKWRRRTDRGGPRTVPIATHRTIRTPVAPSP